jgi:hypothetical protein
MTSLDAPPPPPRELVIDAKPAPGDSSDGGGSAMAPFALSAIGAGVLAKFASPTVALVPLAAALLYVLVGRKAGKGRFVLRAVDDGGIEVRRERSKDAVARIAIADLLDVTLDRKMQASGRAGAATERVRLALERTAPETPIFMPDEHVTPIEAQEWYGKVRVFLRKHGWVPKGERGGGSESATSPARRA